MDTTKNAVTRWESAHCLGARPTTQRFYHYVVTIFTTRWQTPQQDPATISAEQILTFAQSVTNESPSVWNTLVAICRSLTPHGKLLKRRPMNSRAQNPPGQNEFKGLLEECDASERSKAGLVVRFLSLTGTRISEARALEWKDIKADAIILPKEITKNHKPRSIPLLPGIHDVLTRLRVLGDGKHILPRQNPRKALQNACNRAGLPNMSPHTFRHFFATQCIEAGVDVPTVARWLGHQDGGALLSKTYFHLLDDHSREMAKRVQIPT